MGRGGVGGHTEETVKGSFGISSLISAHSDVGIMDICASQLHMDALHDCVSLFFTLICLLDSGLCQMYFLCLVSMVYACKSNTAPHICN